VVARDSASFLRLRAAVKGFPQRLRPGRSRYGRDVRPRA